jgi:hypothetical protein
MSNRYTFSYAELSDALNETRSTLYYWANGDLDRIVAAIKGARRVQSPGLTIEPLDDTHFGWVELNDALRALGFKDPGAKAAVLQRRIEGIRERDRLHERVSERMSEVTGNKPVTITIEELAGAIERGTILTVSTGVRQFKNAHYTSLTHAQNIFSDVQDHRDPELKDGEVVKDDRSVFWKYSTFGGGKWLRFGTSSYFDFDTPTRPLRKV